MQPQQHPYIPQLLSPHPTSHFQYLRPNHDDEVQASLGSWHSLGLGSGWVQSESKGGPPSQVWWMSRTWSMAGSSPMVLATRCMDPIWNHVGLLDAIISDIWGKLLCSFLICMWAHVGDLRCQRNQKPVANYLARGKSWPSVWFSIPLGQWAQNWAPDSLTIKTSIRKRRQPCHLA